MKNETILNSFKAHFPKYANCIKNVRININNNYAVALIVCDYNHNTVIFSFVFENNSITNFKFA